MGKNGQQTPKIHSTGNLILRKVTKKSVYTPKKNIKKKKSRPLGQSGHPLRPPPPRPPFQGLRDAGRKRFFS